MISKPTRELPTATEALYQTFAKYPANPTMDGCPCCVSDKHKSTLHSKRLRQLQDEDIHRYAFKAMTTWGDVGDFKHYLPRIFELKANGVYVVDTFVILGKLEYGNWKDWDELEQSTILEFLRSWWKSAINNRLCFDDELFLEINKRTGDPPALLADWNLELGTQGFLNYVGFIEDYSYDLINRKRPFKSISELDALSFVDWVKSNASRLEAGFFYYEGRDEGVSERISNALYLIEGADL